ncbi:MAG: hypothetical protein ACOX87_01090 [Chloroflexota bacterium]
MINVTPEAKDVLHDMLQQTTDDEEMGIRLIPAVPPGEEEGGQVALGMTLDRTEEGDQIVEHNGRKVLILDPTMSQLLDGDTLAIVETPEGKRLALNREAA